MTEVLYELADASVADALVSQVAALMDAGAVLFELIAGAPVVRYGVRLTFRPAHPGGAAELCAAAGLQGHPWGPADWVGVRAGGGVAPRCKAYHRRPPPIGITTVHRGLPPGMQPVMAALDADTLEVYAIAPGEQSWPRFAESCLGEQVAAAVTFEPMPLRHPGAHAISVKHVADALTAVTLYAMRASLPADAVTMGRWVTGLDDSDRAHYGRCVRAVQRLGAPRGKLHGLAAWTFEGGARYVSRAVSLRVHPPGSRSA